MEGFNNERFPRGESPGNPDIFGRETQTESSKRQQCVCATELAKRTGLENRCVWLLNPAIWLEGNERSSGKVFDESGRRTVTEVPGGKVSWNNRRPCFGHAGCFMHGRRIHRKKSGGKCYAGR